MNVCGKKGLAATSGREGCSGAPRLIDAVRRAVQPNFNIQNYHPRFKQDSDELL